MQGFKSFVDLTQLFFQTNRSAIVGPNGCGKSNVIDAIRWVMGESSAKFLRGDLMADVIFNGSQTRKAAGQASVEIILDNHQGYLEGAHIAHADLALRREINRHGDSSYSINGKKVRRKDLNDLWLGTGAGARGYAIIGQNMVHHLVEANPDVLRGYLEEAAGVSKYKERRKESAERLLHVEENMARIRDLILELEQGIQRLALEAQDAKTYHHLQQQLRSYQALALVAQARSLEHKQQDLRQKRQVSDTQFAELELHLAKQQARLQELETEVNGLQTETLAIEQGLFKQNLALEQAEKNHLERLRQQKSQQAEFERLQQELQDISNQLQIEEQGLKEKNGSIEQLIQSQNAFLVKEQKDQESLQSLEIKLRQLKQEAHVKRQKQQQQQTQLQVLLTKKQHVEENLNQARAQIQKWKQEQNQHQDLGLQTAITQAELDLQAKTLAEAKLAQTLVAVKQEEELWQSKLDQAIKNTKVLADNYQALAQEFALEQASYQGLLTSMGEVSDRSHLDAWLKTWQIADEWRPMLDFIWQRFLPVSLGLVEQLSELPIGYLAHLQAYKVSKQDDWPLVSLLSFMGVTTYPSGFMPWPKIWVAASREQAWSLRAQLEQNASMMTADGLWLGPDWSMVVSFTQRGLASQLQILTKLEQALNQAEQEWQLSQALLAEVRLGYDLLAQQAAHLKHEYDDLKLNLRRMTQEQEQRIQQRQRMEYELQRCHQELSQAEENNANLSLHLAQLRQEEDSLNIELQQCSESIEELGSRIKDQETQVLSMKQADQAQKTRFNGDQLKLQALQIEAQFLAQNSPKLKARQTLIETRQHDLTLAMTQALKMEENLSIDFASMRLNLTEEATKLKFKKDLGQEKIQQSLVLQRDLEQGKQEQLKLMQVKWRIDSEFEQINDKIQALQLDLNADFSPSLWQDLPQEQNEVFFRQKQDEISQQLQALGDVNLLAIGLFEQEQKRYQSLVDQEQDLVLAMQELQKAIATLDQDMQLRLEQTLQAINQHLFVIFPQLFGGGQAKFVASCDNLLEANVAIEVQLPGKKQHRIQLLSGGEKALTAIALLFAIFALNPAPFCLLDEVDAALDDANVLRLASLIKTMSASVQFILITHNPLTMNVAEELLGVTMQEPGVSRVVSVNVATALAMVNKE